MVKYTRIQLCHLEHHQIPEYKTPLNWQWMCQKVILWDPMTHCNPLSQVFFKILFRPISPINLIWIMDTLLWTKIFSEQEVTMQTLLWVLWVISLHIDIQLQILWRGVFSQIKWIFIDTYLSRSHLSIGQISLKFILKKNPSQSQLWLGN